MPTDHDTTRSRPNPSVAEWKRIVAPYEAPSVWRATWQIVDTLGPYVLLWVLMVHSLAVSWWLTVPLAALAGTLLVRVFIIFHDCGHGSFFRSRLANDVTGFIAGMLTLTPYYHWRWEHSLHHATTGDLDRRGAGDVWTMTVQEYLESSRWKRFAYRLARNPIVLFVLAPLFLFVVRHRFPSVKASSRERKSVMWMNLAILAMATALSWVFGLLPYLVIQSTVMMVGGRRACGCSTCSTSSRTPTGNAATTGTTLRRRSREARSTNCPGSSNGSPATSDSTTSIT